MELALVRKLVERGIIKEETEVEAEYHALDISGMNTQRFRGSFLVLGVREDANKEPIFEVASTLNGRRRRLKSEAIVAIDGMDPARVASIYNIKPDGSDKTPGKRRGRKPKMAVQ